jgi:hypothetical protein
LTYVNNFSIDCYSVWRKRLTILILAATGIISYYIYKFFIKDRLNSFLNSVWRELWILFPIALFILILFVQSVLYDGIRNYHYSNFTIQVEGIMIDSKYYYFPVKDVKWHGQITYNKLEKSENQKVVVEYSEKNPVINRPIR